MVLKVSVILQLDAILHLNAILHLFLVPLISGVCHCDCRYVAVYCSVSQRVAVLQRVAVCCSELQHVAACCGVALKIFMIAKTQETP